MQALREKMSLCRAAPSRAFAPPPRGVDAAAPRSQVKFFVGRRPTRGRRRRSDRGGHEVVWTPLPVALALRPRSDHRGSGPGTHITQQISQ